MMTQEIKLKDSFGYTCILTSPFRANSTRTRMYIRDGKEFYDAITPYHINIVRDRMISQGWTLIEEITK